MFKMEELTLPEDPLYSEEERTAPENAFGPYFDGQRERYADPIRVKRVLNALLGGDTQKAVERTCHEVPQVAIEAMDRLVEAACLALELVPFDSATGQGMNEISVIETYNAYIAFVKKKSVIGQGTQTWPTATESPPSDSLANSPTECGSASN